MTPQPRLSETLPYPRDLRCCQACGPTLPDLPAPSLAVWREHDEADLLERIYVVLCDPCAARLIEPHPRLYRRMDPWAPVPGIMPACLDCAHRKGLACGSPLLKANGGPGLPIRAAVAAEGFACTRGKGCRPFVEYAHAPDCDGRSPQPEAARVHLDKSGGTVARAIAAVADPAAAAREQKPTPRGPVAGGPVDVDDRLAVAAARPDPRPAVQNAVDNSAAASIRRCGQTRPAAVALEAVDVRLVADGTRPATTCAARLTPHAPMPEVAGERTPTPRGLDPAAIVDRRHVCRAVVSLARPVDPADVRGLPPCAPDPGATARTMLDAAAARPQGDVAASTAAGDGRPATARAGRDATAARPAAVADLNRGRKGARDGPGRT